MSKYKGSIEFNSKRALFVFNLARWLARLSFICAIVSGFVTMGSDISVRGTPAGWVPTMAFLGIHWLLKIAVNSRIKSSMKKTAKRRGLILTEYKKQTSKSRHRTSFDVAAKAIDPKSERGKELRAHNARRSYDQELDYRLKAVPRIRRTEGSYRGVEDDIRKSFTQLKAAQAQGQAIVDQVSRNYALSEYGALNDLSRHQVEVLLGQENGHGRVTSGVNKIYASVHYEYKAYFENKDGHTPIFSLAPKGYHEVQGVDGSKKRVYHTDRGEW